LLDHVIRPNSGWGLPGGFLEHGEQPEEGIKRELREEIDLELFDLKILRVRTVGSHVEILFTASASGEPKISSNEIKSFGWFRHGELPAEMNQSQMYIIETAMKC
ncbi:MAG: NUDIX hydrolase, partial [Acidobacteria bacterium]|nr:NUDIX hydrolase [Acidobacteriota bacterium]